MISEEDFEDEAITPEVVTPNRLTVMVKESQLDNEKSNFILKTFGDHFKLAAEWAKEAKSIIVTNGTQTAMIKKARDRRLKVREARLEIEKVRKFLKEQSLREGQAIDKISNFLKDMLIPTEQHLERQEKFVELKKAAEDEAKRIEVEKKLEEDRLAKEAEDAKETERLRLENEKLKAEAARKQKIMDEEIKKKEADLEKVRKIAEAERKKHQEEIDRIQQEKEEAEENLRQKEEELQSVVEVQSKEKENDALATDSEKLAKLRADIEAIHIPDVIGYDSERIIAEVKSHLYLAVSRIKPVVVEEEF